MGKSLISGSGYENFDKLRSKYISMLQYFNHIVTIHKLANKIIKTPRRKKTYCPSMTLGISCCVGTWDKWQF